MLLIYCILLAVLLENSNSKLNVNSTLSAYQLIEELFDAFDRKDYVDVWIKLIDLQLQLNPPGLFTKEMIHLLILRKRLVKFHKYYLKVHPSRVPVNNFTNNYDSNWLTEQDLSPILDVLNAVTQETNSLVGGQTLIDDNPVSEDQISNIFNSIVSNLISTTEDSLSTGVSQGVGNEKPLLGSQPNNNVKFSEETNNAIYDSMTQLSNLVESAPRPNQLNCTSTSGEKNQQNTETITVTSTTTTTDSSNIPNNNGSGGATVNDAVESLFSIFNVFGNSN